MRYENPSDQELVFDLGGHHYVVAPWGECVIPDQFDYAVKAYGLKLEPATEKTAPLVREEPKPKAADPLPPPVEPDAQPKAEDPPPVEEPKPKAADDSTGAARRRRQ